MDEQFAECDQCQERYPLAEAHRWLHEVEVIGDEYFSHTEFVCRGGCRGTKPKITRQWGLILPPEKNGGT